MSYPDGNPKTALGAQKPTLWVIPPTGLLALGGVMALGARKYGPFNWRDKSISSTVYYDAALRHLLSWLDGETIDPESGQSHLGHVMACCAILLDAEANGVLNDNRPKPGVTAELIRKHVNDNSPSTEQVAEAQKAWKMR